jgi:hypothetical protein
MARSNNPRHGRKAKKKISDKERAEAIFGRAVEQIRRTSKGRAFNRLAEAGGAKVTDAEIEKAGYIRAIRSDGSFEAVENVLATGPARILRKIKLRDIDSREIVSSVDFDEVEVVGLEDMVSWWPVFIDLSASWSDISAVLEESFVAAQKTMIEHEIIDSPRRTIHAADADLINTLDAHRRLTDENNGIEPSQEELGRELGVGATTAMRRWKKAQALFEDSDESELRALISKQKKDDEAGNYLGGGQTVEYKEELDYSDETAVGIEDLDGLPEAEDST